MYKEHLWLDGHKLRSELSFLFCRAGGWCWAGAEWRWSELSQCNHFVARRTLLIRASSRLAPLSRLLATASNGCSRRFHTRAFSLLPQGFLCVAGPHVVALKSPPVVCWPAIGPWQSAIGVSANHKSQHNWRGISR